MLLGRSLCHLQHSTILCLQVLFFYLSPFSLRQQNKSFLDLCTEILGPLKTWYSTAVNLCKEDSTKLGLTLWRSFIPAAKMNKQTKPFSDPFHKWVLLLISETDRPFHKYVTPFKWPALLNTPDNFVPLLIKYRDMKVCQAPAEGLAN